ncbi:MAG: hypothetical protein BroJett003_16320 [Planctomycetota bacterium]|nr:MAG: hypothetical protein BroJett003_16320 [Planctomycetota bacterium]
MSAPRAAGFAVGADEDVCPKTDPDAISSPNPVKHRILIAYPRGKFEVTYVHTLGRRILPPARMKERSLSSGDRPASPHRNYILLYRNDPVLRRRLPSSR